ncbi:MAG TPA: DUF58 domain-containing protein [Anaerolineales bacterium]
MRPAPDPSLRLRSRLLPLLVIVLLVMQLLDPFRGWSMLLIGLGGAWFASYLWARSLKHNLRLVREKRFGWAQVGDRLEERFTLKNDGKMPGLWVEIEDHSTLPGYLPSRVTGVGGWAVNRWRTQAACEQRGVYTLGPTTLRTADPLGLYSVEIHDPSRADLVVMPPVVPLPHIEIAPGGQAGEGRPRPDAPERTQAASSVRPFVHGDSLRWVHWRTSARRDQFYVRLFDSTPSSDWWIFIDMDRRVQAGEGQASTEEHSVILAASLADRGLRQGRRVGLVAYGKRLVWIPPQEGGEHRWEILRALATVAPGESSLGELLEHTRHSIRQRASLILITPNVHGDWLEALLPLTWRGSVPTVLLLDPSTFGNHADNRALLASLAESGIQGYSISRELLERPEAVPGKAGRWEWRVSPTGRAVAVRRPHDLDWKVLS